MWPKRMKVHAFCKHGFVEGSGPSPRVLREKVISGEVPGEMIGKSAFVWVGPNMELMAPGTDAGSAIADSILQDWNEEHGQDAAA